MMIWGIVEFCSSALCWGLDKSVQWKEEAELVQTQCPADDLRPLLMSGSLPPLSVFAGGMKLWKI